MPAPALNNLLQRGKAVWVAGPVVEMSSSSIEIFFDLINERTKNKLNSV